MNRSNSSDLSTAGITANLLKTHEILLVIVNQSSVAEEALRRGDLQQAFGALVGVGQMLEQARTLQQAALLLYQWRRS